MKRIIIDTDPGIDDAAAIFLALASPEVSVEAITTIYGNGPVGMCTANARRILQAAERLDIPVYQGASKPLLRDPNPGWALQVHGADALGNTNFPLPADDSVTVHDRHAALEIIDRVMESPGEITLLALGRMTNISLALSIEPRLAHAVAQIVLMGGAVSVPGNVSPVASANFYEDPEAASILFSSGAPLVQVGLDVCDRVTINPSQLERIGRANNPIARLLNAVTPCLRSFYRRQGLLTEDEGVRYNDIPAVAFAIDPSLYQTRELYVAIETHSPLTRGQTVADRRNSSGQPPNATVCLDVDAPRLTDWFTERITGYRANAASG